MSKYWAGGCTYCKVIELKKCNCILFDNKLILLCEIIERANYYGIGSTINVYFKIYWIAYLNCIWNWSDYS
jgi:hypothetical protein